MVYGIKVVGTQDCVYTLQNRNPQKLLTFVEIKKRRVNAPYVSDPRKKNTLPSALLHASLRCLGWK